MPKKTTINLLTGPHGSINPSGSGQYDFSSYISVAATPDPGYEVDEIRLDNVPLHSASPYSYQVPGDGQHTFVALFRALKPAQLKGMGQNRMGQLATNNLTQQNYPVTIAPRGVSLVAMGYEHTMFVKADGSLWVLGGNTYGQLGLGDTSNRWQPVQVAIGGVNVYDVVAIAAGSWHSLFLQRDGSAWAMGRNDSGQLGCGNTANSLVPVQVGNNVIRVAAGDAHSLFLTWGGDVLASGSNASGQVGQPAATSQVNSPTAVTVGGFANEIAAGFAHSVCVVAYNPVLWGDDSCGQLGNGAYGPGQNCVPYTVSTNTDHITAGGHATAWRNSDGSWSSMGNNSYGHIGAGKETKGVMTPIDKPTTVIWPYVTRISIGHGESLVTLSRPDQPPDELWGIGANPWGDLGVGAINPVAELTQAQASGVFAVAQSARNSGFLCDSQSPQAYGFTFRSNNGKGHVQVRGTTAPLSGILLDAGATGNFEICPDAGYRIDTVSVDDVAVTAGLTFNGDVGSYPYPPVAGNHAMWVNYVVKTPKPVLDPPPGAVAPGTLVTITCADPAAMIHFTTDGSRPDTFSSIYSAPIEVSAETTIYAIAYGADLSASDQAGGLYLLSGKAAIQSTGVGCYLSSTAVNLDANPFTIAFKYAWTAAVTAAVMVKGDPTAGPAWDVYFNAGKLAVRWFDRTTKKEQSFQTQDPLPADGTMHAVLIDVGRNPGTCTISLDGKNLPVTFEHDNGDPGDLTSDTTFSLAAAVDGSSPYPGKLGEVSISGSGGGEWLFGETSGSTRKDSSGNGHDLADNGNVQSVAF